MFNAKNYSFDTLKDLNYSFDSIKERVQNAQQGLTESWKTIADKAKKDVKVVNKIARKALATEDGGKLRDGYVTTVDLNAGYDLFKVFQTNWVQIHKTSVTNVKQAGEVDKQLNAFIKDWQKYDSYMEEFLGNLAVLPEVLSNLETIQQRVTDIGAQTEKIEDLLLEYEDSCERFELEKCKIDMKIKLSQLVETQHAEYTLKKSIVAEGKNNDVDEVAKEMSAAKIASKPSVVSVSAEKQKAYEDAFLDQMNQYIQYGEIEKPIAGVIDENETPAVEDIDINDSDLSTLREFLGEDEMNSVLQAQASQNRLKTTEAEDPVSETTALTADNSSEITDDPKPAPLSDDKADEVAPTDSATVVEVTQESHIAETVNQVAEDDDDDDEHEFFDAPTEN